LNEHGANILIGYGPFLFNIVGDWHCFSVEYSRKAAVGLKSVFFTHNSFSVDWSGFGNVYVKIELLV
jgi:hypothetical protein